MVQASGTPVRQALVTLGLEFRSVGTAKVGAIAGGCFSCVALSTAILRVRADRPLIGSLIEALDRKYPPLQGVSLRITRESDVLSLQICKRHDLRGVGAQKIGVDFLTPLLLERCPVMDAVFDTLQEGLSCLSRRTTVRRGANGIDSRCTARMVGLERVRGLVPPLFEKPFLTSSPLPR